MEEPRICIVIVNYNGEKYQNDCIRTIKASSYHNYEIVVVDNDSKDKSMELLKQDYPEVTNILLDDNIGVTGGNNAGIQYSINTGAEYTLLLNNDVELDKDTILKLVERANTQTVVVPKIYYFDKSMILWYAGGELDWNWGTGIHSYYGEKDNELLNMERLVTYSPTCCMLVHNSIFDKMGNMDEAYFMYFDDTDFCVRLQENKIKLLYVPSSFLWHKVSSSTGGESSKLSVYYMSRNQLYYMNKFRNRVKCTAYMRVFTRGTLRYIRSFFFKKNCRVIFKGYMDYWNDKMYKKDS